jgi:hypothetical protein
MPPDHGAMFIQSPGVLVFPAVSFVVDINFYWFVVRQYAGLISIFFLFVKTCFVTYNMISFGESSCAA